MTNDPYGFKPKYFQARRDYARLLETINSIALTAESQLDAQNDVDLVRVQEHHAVEAERDRMQQRLATEHSDHIHDMTAVATYLATSLSDLRAGRKKKARENIRQAISIANRNLPPF